MGTTEETKLLTRAELKPGLSCEPAGPNGENIAGTLERIYGTAEVNSVEIVDGSGLVSEYSGSTDVCWDSQTTVMRRKQAIWVTTDGLEISENKLRFKLIE